MTCRKCLRTKAATEFYPSNPTYCKPCRLEATRAWRKQNVAANRGYTKNAYRRMCLDKATYAAYLEKKRQYRLKKREVSNEVS